MSETVELKVRVPRAIVEFVRDHLLRGEDQGKYWTEAIIQSVGADLDHDGYTLKKDILKRYGVDRFIYLARGGET